MIEVIMLLGGYSWASNIIGGLIVLIDEPLKKGSCVSFQKYQGVVESLQLQSFSVRQYDKSLVYVPNGILMDNLVEIHTDFLEQQCRLFVHCHPTTNTSAMRQLVQSIDYALQQRKGRRYKEPSKKLWTALKRGRTRGELRTSLMVKWASEKEEDQTPQHRFWVTIVDAYTIEVVYYIFRHNQKAFMAEKTEVLLEITAIIQQLGVRLDDDAYCSRSHEKRLASKAED
ncbi:unnamed protein product [Albugo candida]|nr:unnamed protein product [Albugo candida]|eukprot:CCI46860.1 unnamed protein product [Albugo candida]